MSLIFEGLKRNNHLKRQPAKITPQTELSEDAQNLPGETLASRPPESSQTPAESNPSCITANYFPKNNPLKKHKKNNSAQIITNANESLPTRIYPPKISNQSTKIQVSSNAARTELRDGLQCSQFVFEPQKSTKLGLLSIFKNKLTGGLIVLESLLIAPYKLLKFLCGTPLQSINFCSNWTVSLFIKLWKNVRIFGPAITNIFTKLTQLCYFIALRLPVLGLAIAGPFFKRQWSLIRECIAVLIYTLRTMVRRGLLAIGNLFSSLFSCYRLAFDRALSIYLPNSWIQNATVFLLKSSAIALSCCFVVMMLRNAINPPKNTENLTNNFIALEKNTAPQRKLKHLFKDPLIVKQEKVHNTLLAFHVDTIQRYGEGKGLIMTNNQTFGIGALLNEHPKIYLEKIGKNSLYFSDKYGQMYKRAIRNMLE